MSYAVGGSCSASSALSADALQLYSCSSCIIFSSLSCSNLCTSASYALQPQLHAHNANGTCTPQLNVNGRCHGLGRLHERFDACPFNSVADLLPCRYQSCYQADPSTYKVPAKTGGRYWFEERQRQAAGNTAPFNSSTTYAAEMLQGEHTVQQQKQQVQGLPSTLVNYQVARQHRYECSQASCLITSHLQSVGGSLYMKFKLTRSAAELLGVIQPV